MKVNRQNIAEHLFEKQLELIGKTLQEAIDNRNWKGEWWMTEEEFEQFKSYSIPLIKKTFKCNKSKAESTLNWFILQFGLKIGQ
jgi:hypothetical protein